MVGYARLVEGSTSYIINAMAQRSNHATREDMNCYLECVLSMIVLSQADNRAVASTFEVIRPMGVVLAPPIYYAP